MLSSMKNKIRSTLKVLLFILVSVIFRLYATHIFLPDLKINELILLNNIKNHDQPVMNVDNGPKVIINSQTANNLNNQKVININDLIHPPLEIINKDLDISAENLEKTKDATYLIDILRDDFYLKFLLRDNINTNNPSINMSIIDRYSKIFKIEIDSKSYVLKRLSNGKFNSNDLLANQFDSSNVVKILASFSRDFNNVESYTWFISEYLDVDVNSSYIINGDIETLRKMAVDLLNGLDALHKQKVAHQDIYQRNIRGKTEEDGSVTFKLLDLGVATKYDESLLIAAVRLDIRQLNNFLYRTTTIMKNFKDFSESDKAKYSDFCLVADGYTDNKVKNVQDLLDHPFITGASLDIKNDKYGERRR